ncbi:hypothetical protein NDU88_007580 [Pleurodeles waltl]|uniref:Uncharacterized protein n=1 Tax=Pleurodeles waltl TaxID=8319 RepID=A0AAV7PN11_PLEWA|nr:hypothetical protein NDU88_007580 [Pleurodeles waltl]
MKGKCAAPSLCLELEQLEIERAINKHAAPGCGTHGLTLNNAQSVMERDSSRGRNPVYFKYKQNAEELHALDRIKEKYFPCLKRVRENQ